MRAGVVGIEGLGIGNASGTLASEAALAVLVPSCGVAVATEQLWIPPVAVIGTWFVVYIGTNGALSYGSDQINHRLLPRFGLGKY